MRTLLLSSLIVCVIVLLPSNGFGIRRLFRLGKRRPVMSLVTELSNSTDLSSSGNSTSSASKTQLFELNNNSVVLNTSSVDSLNDNLLQPTEDECRKDHEVGFLFLSVVFLYRCVQYQQQASA